MASENNNFGKLSGSYQNKTNYKFKLSAMGSTIEVIKNTSGNNSYQNQLFANGTNEKYNDLQDAKEKLTVNKTNLRGLKIKLDKNKSFMTKNDKRDMSFNKREITPRYKPVEKNTLNSKEFPLIVQRLYDKEYCSASFLLIQ